MRQCQLRMGELQDSRSSSLLLASSEGDSHLTHFDIGKVGGLV